MIKNNYLDIAKNDLAYLESVLASGNTFYNQLAVQCQQVTEKYLKGYLEVCFLDEDVSDLLRKHNMKKIASRMNSWKPELNLDTVGLAYLTDFFMMQDIRMMIFILSQKRILKNVRVLCTTLFRNLTSL